MAHILFILVRVQGLTCSVFLGTYPFFAGYTPANSLNPLCVVPCGRITCSRSLRVASSICLLRDSNPWIVSRDVELLIFIFDKDGSLRTFCLINFDSGAGWRYLPCTPLSGPAVPIGTIASAQPTGCSLLNSVLEMDSWFAYSSTPCALPWQYHRHLPRLWPQPCDPQLSTVHPTFLPLDCRQCL
jgi:hypothetical protein